MLLPARTRHQSDSGVSDSNFSATPPLAFFKKPMITSSLLLVSHKAGPLMTFTFFFISCLLVLSIPPATPFHPLTTAKHTPFTWKHINTHTHSTWINHSNYFLFLARSLTRLSGVTHGGCSLCILPRFLGGSKSSAQQSHLSQYFSRPLTSSLAPPDCLSSNCASINGWNAFAAARMFHMWACADARLKPMVVSSSKCLITPFLAIIAKLSLASAGPLRGDSN